MQFLKLFQELILRNIREERFLTLLSVIGVALGIGLFLGVNIATSRALASFESSVAALDSGSTYEVVHQSGIAFSESAYRPVREIASKSLPVLATTAYLPAQRRAVEITGLSTVKALGALNSGSAGAVDIEAFFTHLNGVLITRRFSSEQGVRQGDVLTALVYNRQYRLTVVGVLDLASLPAGSLLMDLGNYQELFGKSGFLSRIDIKAGPQQAERIARKLPPELMIQKKEQVIASKKALVDSFRINLRFVTFLAVLVGVFLLYNTVFISVLKRRTDIGILRGLGMGRTTIVALFCAQGALLGLTGSVLGVVLGWATASLASSAVAQTVSRFYGGVPVSGPVLSLPDALGTVGFGVALSFLSSLLPALESATVRPMESTRAGTFERTSHGRQKLLSLSGLVLILCGAALITVDYRFVPFSFPWLSHAGILLFILGCTLNAPAYLGMSLTALKTPLRKFFKTAPLAAGDIAGTRYRFSLALMSVAVSSALIVAIVSSIFSLRRSFVDWLATYVSADVYIKPASCTSNFCFDPLPENLVKTAAALPGVETVGRFRSLRVDFHGRSIVAGFGDSSMLWKRRPRIAAAERERLQRLVQRPEVILSEYLAVRYGLKKGDVLPLRTPKGTVRFIVNNTSISYSTLSGFLYFDRRWLKEYWGLDDSTQLSVYLARGQDARQFINALQKSAGAVYALEITDTSELRQSVLRVFDRSFAVTYTIELIAIIISLIGVVNALLILALEKKREISVLRYLGAGWRHIRQVMMLSAAVLGVAGIVLGCCMGVAIGIVITHVINRISFGWEVAFQVPVLTVTLLMALLLVTTMLAGIVPAWVARKIDPKAFISFE